jgi:hypothetical protein
MPHLTIDGIHLHAIGAHFLRFAHPITRGKAKRVT